MPWIELWPGCYYGIPADELERVDPALLAPPQETEPVAVEWPAEVEAQR